jgi:RimK family alpha-L-glutamate ligase
LQRAASAAAIPVSKFEWSSLERNLGLGDLPMDACQAILVRTMPLGTLEQVIFRMDALYERQAAGCAILNSPTTLEIGIDKYRTLVELARAGVPVPRTHVCQTVDAAMAGFAALGGAVVVKPLFGSEGRGILQLTDEDLAWRTFQTLERMQAVIYQQEWIRHPGYDIRAFVLDGRILAAMRRSHANDWRTNASRGAVCTPELLTPALADLAFRAARAVSAWAVGVDLLTGPDGVCYVIEVNAVPGWQALSRACAVDVAAALVRSAVGKCA